jgi:hypothetical protein
VTLPTDLKRLNKGPEQNSNGVALTQELDETGSPEQSQESNVDEIFLLKIQNFFSQLN